jgi:uncharacterized membrane protein
VSRPAGSARRRWAPALALILIGGGLLILPRLGAQSLWVDEGLTILAVTDATNVHDLFDRVRAVDTQPPASHLVLYAARNLVPHSEFGWRLPSFFLSEAAIVLLWLAVARRFGSALATAAAAAAQISPFVAFYAMEARGYALWLFACCGALYAMQRWIEAPGYGWAMAWGLANALGLWTHPFHLFAMLMQMVVAFAGVLAGQVPAGTGRRAIATSLAAQALAVVLFLPYLLAILSGDSIARGVGWTRTPSGFSIFYYPFALVFGFSLGPNLGELHSEPPRVLLGAHLPATAAAAAALLVLGLAAFLLARQAWSDPRRRVTVIAIALALAAGLAGPAIYVVLRSFPLLPRHLIYIWPAIPLLEALALVRLPRLRPALAAVLALQGLALVNLLYNPVYAKDDERGAVHFALRHSGDRPIVLGDVAPFYAPAGSGFPRNRTDPGEATRFADATDVWLADSRAWEDPEGRYRARLQRTLDGLGLSYTGEEGTFRGVVLRHWRREPSS